MIIVYLVCTDFFSEAHFGLVYNYIAWFLSNVGSFRRGFRSTLHIVWITNSGIKEGWHAWLNFFAVIFINFGGKRIENGYFPPKFMKTTVSYTFFQHKVILQNMSSNETKEIEVLACAMISFLYGSFKISAFANGEG